VCVCVCVLLKSKCLGNDPHEGPHITHAENHNVGSRINGKSCLKLLLGCFALADIAQKTTVDPHHSDNTLHIIKNI